MKIEPQPGEISRDAGIERARLVAEIRAGLEEHFRRIGMALMPVEQAAVDTSKETIRRLHSMQKLELAARERKTLERCAAKLVTQFANGNEVVPARVDPVLVPVNSDDDTGLLFRLSTLLWSVPPSRGYGRRMRFLVMDRFNGKLIGVFALGDPVFNLRARDEWVGWSGEDRRYRLTSVMDAYVVGAVPPYSRLLGGKLIASCLGSREVHQFHEAKYGGRQGTISKQTKVARLAMITITSALGRSSLYNRLRLPGLVELIRVGETNGWGHFHVPDAVFYKMRRLLEIDRHRYASGNEFGDGCNWRIRVAKEALARVGMSGNLLRHGISREVYVMPLASNCRDFLTGREEHCDISGLPPLVDIGMAARERWIMPRSQRRPEYRDFRREDLLTYFRMQMEAGKAAFPTDT